MEMHDWKQKQIKKSHELGGGGDGKGKTTTSCCHTGQHSMIPVKHVRYFYTVAVQGLAQETVNVAELECIRGTGLCKCEGGYMNNDNT